MRGAQAIFLRRNAWILVGATVLVVAWVALSPMRPLYRDFPDDYVLPFGDNPFAPSLAMTATGTALDPLTLAGSEGCGAGNCHSEVVEEWQPSAHRYAAQSPFFQGVQGAMAANNGPESTRYCGGCHDPIALFSGSKNLYSDDAPNWNHFTTAVKDFLDTARTPWPQVKESPTTAMRKTPSIRPTLCW